MGQDDWTTLRDVNGHTSQGTGNSCLAVARPAPVHLVHYQTVDQAAGTCDSDRSHRRVVGCHRRERRDGAVAGRPLGVRRPRRRALHQLRQRRHRPAQRRVRRRHRRLDRRGLDVVRVRAGRLDRARRACRQPRQRERLDRRHHRRRCPRQQARSRRLARSAAGDHQVPGPDTSAATPGATSAASSTTSRASASRSRPRPGRSTPGTSSPTRSTATSSSSTSSPTSGTATASPSHAGSTSGSTRASPPTPSGSGRSGRDSGTPQEIFDFFYNDFIRRRRPVVGRHHRRPRPRPALRVPGLLPRRHDPAGAAQHGR